MSIMRQLNPLRKNCKTEWMAEQFYGKRHLHTFGKPPQWIAFEWPLKNGNPQVRVAFKYKDGNEKQVTYEGDWAWFKLLDDAKLTGSENQFELTLTLGCRNKLFISAIIFPLFGFKFNQKKLCVSYAQYRVCFLAPIFPNHGEMLGLERLE